MPRNDYFGLKCFHSVQLTVSTTSIPLPAAIITDTAAQMKAVLVKVQLVTASQGIWYREDGVAAAANVGLLKVNGAAGNVEFEIEGPDNIEGTRLIRSGGSDCVLNLMAYR